MPTIVMTKFASKLEASVRKKAFAFLEKLAENDTTSGLHIEPITNSADPRVRTGRVDQFYRAVLFKIPGHDDATYVFYGIWAHDDAIGIARKTVLSVNPVNGVTEIRVVEPTAEPAPAPPASAARPPKASTVVPPRRSLLGSLGIARTDLVDVLGIDATVADRALEADGEDALLTVAGDAVEWQGLALIDLAAGSGVEEVSDKFSLTPPPEEVVAPAVTEDERLVRGLQRPAARISFAYIEGSEDLRRVIDGGDFAAWRVFLHPEQRVYAEKTYSGPFRLSGGAGTGKTVVLLHRARALSRRTPSARVLVTTYTTNLADAMETDLRRLDPALPHARRLGDAGVYVTGIDALASAVLRRAEPDRLADDMRTVLGVAGVQFGGRLATNPWRDAIASASDALPEALRSEAFFQAEYSTVILPHRITTKEEYLRIRRPGRGVALDRAKRAAVWDVVAACRAQARVAGTLDFQEATAVAAAHLEGLGDPGRLFDHLLVDEGQDLTPVHWQLLRALAAEHPDDLFIAEDSHQRIYGRRTVLGQHGIRIVGRSRRLTLNYRTTAQTLHYAMRILEGGDYVDLEEGAESAAAYRSARTGPVPQVMPGASLAAQFEQAARTVATWVAGSPAPETIAVLVRDRRTRERVAAALAERGVQIRSVDRESVKPGQPVVMTMHRAKGTEFSKVLLFDVSNGSIPAALKDVRYSPEAHQDAVLRERSLLYVAATRARDELAVTYKGSPSMFLGT